jgi:hypothetical protein
MNARRACGVEWVVVRFDSVSILYIAILFFTLFPAFLSYPFVARCAKSSFLCDFI